MIKSGIFSQNAAEKGVVKGGDYVKCKEGLGLIAEVMISFQFEEFKKSEKYKQFKIQTGFQEEDLSNAVSMVRDGLLDTNETSECFSSKWKYSKVKTDLLYNAFCRFCEENKSNENYQY